MRTLITLFQLLLLSSLSFSQSLQIVYDAQTGALRYFENGMELSSPMVKEGQQISIKVENYNNYIYDLQIKEIQEEKRIDNNSSPLAGLQGLGLNQLVNTFATDSDADGIASYYDVEPSVAVEFESSEEQLLHELKNKAYIRMETIGLLKSKFEEVEISIEDYQEKEKFRAIAIQEVNKLKYNPSIPANKVKSTSEAILKEVLSINDSSNPSLSEVIEKNKKGKELKLLLKKQERVLNNYSTEVNTLQALQSELVNRAADRVDLLELFLTMEERITEAPKVTNKGNNNSNLINELIQIEGNRDLSHLMAIWYEYEEISSNDFSTTYNSRGEGDQVVFDLTFQRKESVPKESGAQQLIQLSPIKIPVYGGLKINASVGINFAQFFKRPKSYFVRDSVILGQNGDDFIPMITSFVHVYSQSKGIVALGGSLGIGIPISGDGLNSPSFFIGPSLFFGQSERFVLNAGLMGSKVNRLTAGYLEGDLYPGEENFIPIEGLYELGYFVGLSFNIRK